MPKKKSIDELFSNALAAAGSGKTSAPSKRHKTKRPAAIRKYILGATKPKKPKKVVKADFDDEDSVKLEMAQVLGYEPDDLEISESTLSTFRKGTFYEIEAGRQSWTVARNEDEARDVALATVLQDLESEPENFSADFIQSHINIDRLRNDLYSDVQNSFYDDLTEEAERNPLSFAREHDLEDEIKPPAEKDIRDYVDDDAEEFERIRALEPIEQWEEIGEEPEIPEKNIQTISEEMADSTLKDPMSYLQDIYGSDHVKRAIEIAGIDEEKAAEEAIDTDGWQHFLCRYDGESKESPSGFIYWRDN